MLYTKDELETARLNRERVKSGETNAYYDQQRNIAEGWAYGTKPPEGLRLGELPYLGKETNA